VPEHRWTGPWVRLARDLVVIVVLYFVVPLGAEKSDPVLWVRLAIVIAGFSLVGMSVVRRVTRELRGDSLSRGIEGLLVSVVVAVVFSAAADYVVATTRPGEFEGLATRIDALYFALTTLATVGYGDIHPVGQVAKALVCIQLVLNVAVIATAAGLISRGLMGRARQHGPDDR
jgi:voltage-gated potassium channel